jgi:cytochrome c-type biogenesis protein CcmH/NrfG/O-antigen ligase
MERSRRGRSGRVKRERERERTHPETVPSRIRLLGVALVCAKVALIPVVFDYAMDIPFTVAKSLLSHGLTYALAGVLLALVVRFGRAFLTRSPLHLLVLAFLLVNVGASLFAADLLLALYGTHARMLGLGTVADWVVLYFGIALLVRTRAEVVAVVSSALSASLVVLTYEFVQLLGRDPLAWNMDVEARPISTIGQATSLAQYLTTLAVGVVGLALFTKGELGPTPRVFFVVLGSLLLAGTAMSGTRSALLGLASGSALLLVAMWLRRPSQKARIVAVVGTAFVSAVVTGLVLLSPLGARIAPVASPSTEASEEDVLARLEPAGETRAALYAIALAMLRERPILGYGPDNYVVGVPKFRSEREPVEIRQSLATSAHSWIAFVATSSGLVGLLTYVAIAVLAVWLSLRAIARPVAVIGAAMVAAFLGTGLTTINEISTDWLFWASAGMVAAATSRPFALERATPSHRVGPSRARHLGSALCVLVGLVLAFTPINAWEAARLNRSGQQLRLQGRGIEAIDTALRSTRLDPRRSEYWHGLGLAYVSASRWSDATAAFNRASTLAPYDARKLGDLATAQMIQADSGDAAARVGAVSSSERAIAVDPNNPGAHLLHATVMRFAGDGAAAIRAAERALKLDPRSSNVRLWVTAAQIYVDASRPADAVRVSREGVSALGPTPASVPIRYELARALALTDRSSDALAELDIALAIQPTNTAVQRLRAEIVAGQLK